MVETRMDCFMDTASHGRQPLFASSDDEVCPTVRHWKFYEYYQISRDDESDEAASEPTKEGELATEYEGSHSPFGLVWQIANATGWSREYILNGVNYQTLMMMLADAPRYVKKKKSNMRTEEEGTPADDVLNFFQSNLT